VQKRLAARIKQMLDDHPSFGYRTAARLLRFNKKHGAMDLPAQALAGLQTSGRL